jgi:hypothetical protein
MIDELDTVVLTIDLPDAGLKEGDVGAVVLVHEGGAGYEVEFVTFAGESVGVVSLTPEQVRSMGRRELPHARAIA